MWEWVIIVRGPDSSLVRCRPTAFIYMPACLPCCRDPATGKPLSDEQLAGEMGLFLMAGASRDRSWQAALLTPLSFVGRFGARPEPPPHLPAPLAPPPPPAAGLNAAAGFETTGHTSAWALYLLACYPEVEAKVAAELDAAGLLVTPARPHPRALEFADLSNLR